MYSLADMQQIQGDRQRETDTWVQACAYGVGTHLSGEVDFNTRVDSSDAWVLIDYVSGIDKTDVTHHYKHTHTHMHRYTQTDMQRDSLENMRMPMESAHTCLVRSTSIQQLIAVTSGFWLIMWLWFTKLMSHNTTHHRAHTCTRTHTGSTHTHTRTHTHSHLPESHAIRKMSWHDLRINLQRWPNLRRRPHTKLQQCWFSKIPEINLQNNSE